MPSLDSLVTSETFEESVVRLVFELVRGLITVNQFRDQMDFPKQPDGDVSYAEYLMRLRSGGQ